MITQLNITIPQETNCKFLSIWDRSFYNPNLPVDEPTMLITIPGFKYAKKFEYEQNKVLTLNSNSFGLTTDASYNNLDCLPDGIYIIKQTICPADKIFAEYYHLRTCKLESDFDKLLCKTKSPCELTSKEIADLSAKLPEIDLYIKVAKASAESCGDLEKALEFYNYAAKLITRFITSC